MKSVIGTIVIFIGIYIIIETGILGFFAQKSVFVFSLGFAALMLVIAAAVLGIASARRRHGHDDKNDLLD